MHSDHRNESQQGRWTVQAEALLDVAGLLNSTLERDQVLGILAHQFLRIVAADWVVVAELVEQMDQELLLVAGACSGDRPIALSSGARLPLAEEASLQACLRSRTPTWMRSLRGQQLVPNPFASMGASSALLVPLMFREKVLGMLVAGWPGRVRRPSPKEMRLIQGLANLAATAMENAHLYASAERRAAQVTALFEIGRAISANLGLSEILTSIVQKARELLGSDSSFLALLSPDGRELEMTASVGLRTEAMRGLRLGRHQGLGGAVVQSGEPIVVEDYYRAASLQDPPMDIVRREDLLSHIAVPLGDGTNLLGVLYVANRRPSRFGQEDAQLLMAFAKQATIAIQNARLYGEAVSQRETAEGGRRRLQVIIDSMPEGVIIAEGAEGRVSTVNRAGKELLGVEPPTGLALESLPSAVGMFTPGNTPYPWEQFPLTRAIRHGEVCLGVEVVIHRPDGARIAALANAAPFRDPEGHVSGAVVVFQDVSRAKETEQLKDEFVSLVSHELRTPLTSIKGAASTLLRHYSDFDDNTRLELLHDVDEEAERLYRLVENLLDFSRAEAGALRLTTEPVHLGKLAARVVDEVEGMAEGRRFVLSFPPDLPPAEADPLRVEQVLRNLLDNAIKYSPPRGKIQVSGSRSHVMLLVSVRDQGIGIATEDQEKVFGRFERASATGDNRRQGVGLGLAICRRLVEAHGGAIWVESSPGSGSCFHFTLPAVQEEWG